MFQGQAPPFSTISRLPPSPVGCAVVVLAPSVGLITNLLVKTSQGGISKFITRFLFFRINKFSHSEMTMWENLLILKNKKQVINFEIPPCDVLTRRFVIKPPVKIWLKMGTPALETCHIFKQVSDVIKYK